MTAPYRGPPRGVAPEVLFRKLSARHPSARVDWSFWSFEHGQLEARALTGAEVAAAHDDGNPMLRLMAASLRVDGRRLFPLLDDVLDLPEPEVEAAVVAWSAAWSSVSPCYGRCDAAQWAGVLTLGARHPSNQTAVRLMGEAYEVAEFGKYARMLERPGRYYGLPECRVTDGQLMAFRAARRIHEEGFSA